MEREKESNKSRFLRLIVESHGSTILDGDSAPFYGFYPAQLQRLICLVEQETLERAAKVCIDKAMKMENEASLADTEDDAISLRSSAWLISVCGNEIRNLKDNHDKE